MKHQLGRLCLINHSVRSYMNVVLLADVSLGLIAFWDWSCNIYMLYTNNLSSADWKAQQSTSAHDCGDDASPPQFKL